MPGPILAVYCMRLLHTITCPFSKYFQILYIFVQIFKYFPFFPISLCSFSEKSQSISYTFQNRPWVYLLEPNKPNGVIIREYGFLCNVCIKGRFEICQAAETNQYLRHNIDVLKAKWYQFHEIDSDEDNDNEELQEIDIFLENDVRKILRRAMQVLFVREMITTITLQN